MVYWTYEGAYPNRSDNLEANPHPYRAVGPKHAKETKSNDDKDPTDSIYRAVHLRHLHCHTTDYAEGSHEERYRQNVDGGAQGMSAITRLEVNWEVVYASHHYMPKC